MHGKANSDSYLGFLTSNANWHLKRVRSWESVKFTSESKNFSDYNSGMEIQKQNKKKRGEYT